MALVIVNISINIIFTFMSKFEKYKFENLYLTSKILKIFIALFINTGIILVITNIDY